MSTGVPKPDGLHAPLGRAARGADGLAADMDEHRFKVGARIDAHGNPGRLLDRHLETKVH